MLPDSSLSSVEIILIGNYEPDRQPSMQRFARLMEEGLEAGALRRATGGGRRETGDGEHVACRKPDASCPIRVRVVRPAVVVNRFSWLPPLARKWLGYIDKFLLFPLRLRCLARQIRASGGDCIFHICDHSNSPYAPVLRGMPHVVTCHDVFAIRAARGEIPQQPTGFTGRLLQRLIAHGLRHAAAIVCDSEATRRELVRVVQPHPSRTSVVLLHVDPEIFRPASPGAESSRAWHEVIEARALTPGFDRYLLHVGGDAWYKNRSGVLRMFRHMEHTDLDAGLVLVGPSLTGAQEALLPETFRSRVVCLQDLADSELTVLYRGAEALLFPSLDEGFGWPVLEANACGCPAIVSRRGSLPEVGGEAAYYIDPDDEPGAARMVESFLRRSPDEREQARQSALRNAARFSREATIEGYLTLYQQALKA